jgi:hypothetical protein
MASSLNAPLNPRNLKKTLSLCGYFFLEMGDLRAYRKPARGSSTTEKPYFYSLYLQRGP